MLMLVCLFVLLKLEIFKLVFQAQNFDPVFQLSLNSLTNF